MRFSWASRNYIKILDEIISYTDRVRPNLNKEGDWKAMYNILLKCFSEFS